MGINGRTFLEQTGHGVESISPDLGDGRHAVEEGSGKSGVLGRAVTGARRVRRRAYWAALVCILALTGRAQASYLGATTTLNVPSGGPFNPPPLPPIFPKESARAFIKTVQGVRTQAWPIIWFWPAFTSSKETECVATVTPDGCPATTIADGTLSSDFGIGTGADTGHFASSKTRHICCAKSKHSGSSRRYMISTGDGGASLISLRKISRCKWRGPSCLRNCSVFNSALATRSDEADNSDLSLSSRIVPDIAIATALITPAPSARTPTQVKNVNTSSALVGSPSTFKPLRDIAIIVSAIAFGTCVYALVFFWRRSERRKRCL